MSASLGATVFAVAGSDEAGLGIAMFLIAFYAYTTRVRSLFSSQLQGLEPVDQGASGADMVTSKSQIISSWFADQLGQCVFFRRRRHRHGAVFSRAVAIVSIAVRARSYCAESLFDLEVVLGAINFVAGCALLGLRVTLCVGSSRLGMLDYKT